MSVKICTTSTSTWIFGCGFGHRHCHHSCCCCCCCRSRCCHCDCHLCSILAATSTNNSKFLAFTLALEWNSLHLLAFLIQSKFWSILWASNVCWICSQRWFTLRITLPGSPCSLRVPRDVWRQSEQSTYLHPRARDQTHENHCWAYILEFIDLFPKMSSELCRGVLPPRPSKQFHTDLDAVNGYESNFKQPWFPAPKTKRYILMYQNLHSFNEFLAWLWKVSVWLWRTASFLERLSELTINTLHFWLGPSFLFAGCRVFITRLLSSQVLRSPFLREWRFSWNWCCHSLDIKNWSAVMCCLWILSSGGTVCSEQFGTMRLSTSIITIFFLGKSQNLIQWHQPNSNT